MYTRFIMDVVGISVVFHQLVIPVVVDKLASLKIVHCPYMAYVTGWDYRICSQFC